MLLPPGRSAKYAALSRLCRPVCHPALSAPSLEGLSGAWGGSSVLVQCRKVPGTKTWALAPGADWKLHEGKGPPPPPPPPGCLGHAVSPVLGTVSVTQQVLSKDLLTGGLTWALPLRCVISGERFAVSSLHFSHLKWDWTRRCVHSSISLTSFHRRLHRSQHPSSSVSSRTATCSPHGSLL